MILKRMVGELLAAACLLACMAQALPCYYEARHDYTDNLEQNGPAEVCNVNFSARILGWIFWAVNFERWISWGWIFEGTLNSGWIFWCEFWAVNFLRVNFLRVNFWGDPFYWKTKGQKIRPQNSTPIWKFGAQKFASQNSTPNSGSRGAKSPLPELAPETIRKKKTLLGNGCACNWKIPREFLCVIGVFTEKYHLEVPELHKTTPARKPCGRDVLCNRENDSQIVQMCVCVIILGPIVNRTKKNTTKR